MRKTKCDHNSVTAWSVPGSSHVHRFECNDCHAPMILVEDRPAVGRGYRWVVWLVGSTSAIGSITLMALLTWLIITLVRGGLREAPPGCRDSRPRPGL